MPSSACDWSSDVCSSDRSEEHTSELQSRSDLVCRLLLEKKKKNYDLDARCDDQTSQQHERTNRVSCLHSQTPEDMRFAYASLDKSCQRYITYCSWMYRYV